MKKLKKTLTIIIVIVMISSILTACDEKMASTNSRVVEGKPVKVGVLLIDFTDDYISLIRQDLEEIQRKNEGKVEFIFLDSKNDEAIQNDNLNTLIKNHVDAILLNILDVKTAQQLLIKLKRQIFQ